MEKDKMIQILKEMMKLTGMLKSIEKNNKIQPEVLNIILDKIDVDDEWPEICCYIDDLEKVEQFIKDKIIQQVCNFEEEFNEEPSY